MVIEGFIDFPICASAEDVHEEIATVEKGTAGKVGERVGDWDVFRHCEG